MENGTDFTPTPWNNEGNGDDNGGVRLQHLITDGTYHSIENEVNDSELI